MLANGTSEKPDLPKDKSRPHELSASERYTLNRLTN